MRKQNVGFADRLSRTVAPTVADVDAMPSTEIEHVHVMTTSVQRVAAMPNSMLRNCFQFDVFGSKLRSLHQMGLGGRWPGNFVTQAKAEYRVNIGDVLEVAVAGVPELRHRAAVQMDGNISLPLVGMLPVAGLPLPQIRAKIGAALAEQGVSTEDFGWP